MDYGRSRTGLALSDPLGIVCQPLVILAEAETDKLTAAIVSEARAHEVTLIVVGLPRPLGGGTNQQMDDVLRFVDLLRESSEIPVETWDERFTTSLAERTAKGKGPKDAVAACYMLQNYLDRASAKDRR